jgi:hypothetical protein
MSATTMHSYIKFITIVYVQKMCLIVYARSIILAKIE